MEPRDILMGFAHFVGIMFFLYFFLISLSLMGGAFKVLAGDSAGTLFGDVTNPLAGLMVGILATVFVQSSSTTTSIVVSLAASGIITVSTGIYLIFGANIGTSVTNTIVALGFFRDREQMRRGFAGATVHDCFNLMAVALWLPLEWIVSEITGEYGPLGLISEKIAESFTACDKDAEDCEKWTGPLKIVTGELSSLILKADKDVIKDFAQGAPTAIVCADDADAVYKFARKKCAKIDASVVDELTDDRISGSCQEDADGEVDKKAKAKFQVCNGTVVDQEIMDLAQEHYDGYVLNKAGVFADAGLSDQAAGAITLVLSLILLMVCLFGMVKLLTRVLQGQTEEITKKILNMPGPLAIIFGALFTMFVQSSSITTSVLTPLVAIGTVSLESMLPLTLGANIGTTVTGVLASLVGDKAAGFQVAMVHVLFNTFSVVLLYPVPAIRAIPLAAARNLGSLAATFRFFPVVYLAIVFFITPGYLLLCSIGLGSGQAGGIAGGAIGLVVFIGAIVGFTLWYRKMGGKEKLVDLFGKTDEQYEEEAKAKEVAVVSPEP